MSTHGNSSIRKRFRLGPASKITTKYQITLTVCMGYSLRLFMIRAARSMPAVGYCFDVCEKSCLRWNHVTRNAFCTLQRRMRYFVKDHWCATYLEAAKCFTWPISPARGALIHLQHKLALRGGPIDFAASLSWPNTIPLRHRLGRMISVSRAS